jgi:hypothetical protein
MLARTREWIVVAAILALSIQGMAHSARLLEAQRSRPAAERVR